MGNDFGLSNYPDKWELTTLGGLLDSTGGSVQTGPFGSQLHAADYVADGIPSVMPKNISIEGILEEDIARITSEDAQRLSKYLLLDGDVIYSRRGDVEKCALVKPEEAGWLCGTGCLRVRLGEKSTISPNFLHAYLSSPALREWISRNAIGATMPNLNTSILRDVPVLVPESKDIDFIANNWELLNKKIQLNRQTNKTLEKMAQALFKSWFVDFDPVIDNALAAGNTIPNELQDRAARRQQQLAKPDHQPLPDAIRQLFPSEFELTEKLGWVPMGWEIKPLDEIAHYQNGLALQKFRPENEKHFLPVLKIAHLKQGSTDGKEKASTDIKPSCIVDNGDIIFSWSGSLMVDIWCGGKAALNQHLFKVTSEVFPRWYYYFFTVHHLLEFQRIAADKAVTMGHIKREHLSQAKCTVPPIYLLAAGSEHIEPLIEQQIILRKESKQLAKLRDTLLPKLISGELRLPPDAPADAEQQLADAVS